MSQDTLFEKIAAEIVDSIYVMFIDDQQLPEGETTEEQKIAVVLKIMRPLRALPSGYVQVPRDVVELVRHGFQHFATEKTYADHPKPSDLIFRARAFLAAFDGLLAATPTPSDPGTEQVNK